MAGGISVVINALDNEEIIERAIRSVSWADEVVVCDMHSQDKTVEVAKKLGAKVVMHERRNYVEPARNFAVSKTLGNWILVLDTDEEVPEALAKELQKVARENKVSFIEIPRKNIIFGKWMKASMWWPDYNVRFFKKGAVEWSDKIHLSPKTKGEGYKILAEEKFAFVHYHYTTVTQFIERMNRYTTIQAQQLKEEGCKFLWSDVIKKPLGEFLGRFFAHRGFEDGLHGLALSLLQALSFLVMYLKLWEMEGFKAQEISLKDLRGLSCQGNKEINYWFKYGNLSRNFFKRFFQRVINKIS